MNDSETRIRELQEACNYSPDEDGSVDALIDYKDALESASFPPCDNSQGDRGVSIR